jgi:hypothetical protein
MHGTRWQAGLFLKATPKHHRSVFDDRFRFVGQFFKKLDHTDIG